MNVTRYELLECKNKTEHENVSREREQTKLKQNNDSQTCLKTRDMMSYPKLNSECTPYNTKKNNKANDGGVDA